MSLFGQIHPDNDVWHLPARALRVVDGDTYDMELRLPLQMFARERIRLQGVDTAEIFGRSKESEEYQLGMAQKQFVEDWFRAAHEGSADEFPLRMYIARHKGKYGRYIGDVTRLSDGANLTQALLDNFDGVEYNQLALSFEGFLDPDTAEADLEPRPPDPDDALVSDSESETDDE